MSSKEQLMQLILESAVTEVDLMDSSGNGKHSCKSRSTYDKKFIADSDIDEIMDDAAEVIQNISFMRYGFRSSVPKNYLWFEETLQLLDDKRFKIMMRCTRARFNMILDLIKDNELFHGVNSNKQFTPYFQLALVMYRLGSNGTGASIAKIASLFGVGDGGTIDKVTWRVFRCILALEDDYVKWPSDQEKAEIILETSHELPHCIGYLDGTEIPLQDKPMEDHVSYYSRKKQYSIKAQVVGDHKLMIRNYVIGWPGSAHDARMFHQSKLATHPEEFFSGLEWLAADSAYPLTTRIITPFRSNSSTLTAVQRAKFNEFFSSKRVRIENIFGILKQIFPSLESLPMQVSSKTHRFACTWIRVCFILYNIIRPHFDEDGFQYLPANGNPDEDEDEGLLVDPGDIAEAKRIALYSIIFNENV